MDALGTLVVSSHVGSTSAPWEARATTRQVVALRRQIACASSISALRVAATAITIATHFGQIDLSRRQPVAAGPIRVRPHALHAGAALSSAVISVTETNLPGLMENRHLNLCPLYRKTATCKVFDFLAVLLGRL